MEFNDEYLTDPYITSASVDSVTGGVKPSNFKRGDCVKTLNTLRDLGRVPDFYPRSVEVESLYYSVDGVRNRYDYIVFVGKDSNYYCIPASANTWREAECVRAYLTAHCIDPFCVDVNRSIEQVLGIDVKIVFARKQKMQYALVEDLSALYTKMRDVAGGPFAVDIIAYDDKGQSLVDQKARCERRFGSKTYPFYAPAHEEQLTVLRQQSYVDRYRTRGEPKVVWLGGVPTRIFSAIHLSGWGL